MVTSVHTCSDGGFSLQQPMPRDKGPLYCLHTGHHLPARAGLRPFCSSIIAASLCAVPFSRSCPSTHSRCRGCTKGRGLSCGWSGARCIDGLALAPSFVPSAYSMSSISLHGRECSNDQNPTALNPLKAMPAPGRRRAAA